MNPIDDPLLRFRPEFPQLDECRYLVSHSLGAMPRGARLGLERFAESWRERGVRAWAEGWWEMPRTVGDRVASLTGAAPGSVVMQPNVTLATAAFLSALDFDDRRNTIVTTELEFPSVLYLLGGMSARGVRVHRVPSPDGITIDPQALVAAIDTSTRVIVLSHVLFRSSAVVDPGPVVERAREVGAVVLLDTYQSVGILPVDFAALGVDAAVGGCLKWLCGGPGNSFLYVRPELADELRPRLTGWQAHRDPFAFDDGELDRLPGAARFLNGTPAISALHVAKEGLRLVVEAGIGEIRAKSRRLTALMIERADAAGWTVRTPRDPGRRGGTVTLDPPHSWGVYRALLAADILVDYRPGSGIRLAPHFYNREDEVVAALDAIESILASGEWKRFGDRPRGGVN